MSVVGTVASVWRYPVKSMCGEELEQIFLGFSGVYGDRIFAFKSAASPAGFPYLTGREQQQMVRYRPRFRNAAQAAQPLNLSEAEALGSGVTPLYADAAEMLVEVETPAGETFAIDDPALIERLRTGIGHAHTLSLLRSEQRALTDCRPVSLFSLQTARQLEHEIGSPVDARRFRANVYLDLASGEGFGEDALVGRSVRIGARAVVAVLARDGRCKMITLDPDTGASNPDVLRQVTQAHEGRAGVYCAVLVEGTVRKGDAVELL